MTNKSKFSVRPDGLLKQNIVFTSGLVTAPIIVAATTVERAAILTLSFFMMSYLSILICRFIPQKIAYSVRILLYSLVAAAMFIPTMLCMDKLFPGTSRSVALYIELLVVNSLLLAKTESRFYLKPYGEMMVDVLFYIAGYAIAAFAVGIVREILAFGTVFGLNLFEPVMPSAKSPFFGFILVGIFAAVFRTVQGTRKTRRKEREV